MCVCVCVCACAFVWGGGEGGCARVRLSLCEIAQALKTINLARPNLIIQIFNLHNGRFLEDADFERLSELLHTRWPSSPSHETRALLHFAQAAGIAQWLELRNHDRKVAGSSPGRGCGRNFFSRVHFLC